LQPLGRTWLPSDDLPQSPDEAASATATKEMKQRFGGALTVKGPEEKLATARRLLAEADKPANADAFAYAMLTEASELAVNGGDPMLATCIVDEMAARW